MGELNWNSQGRAQGRCPLKDPALGSTTVHSKRPHTRSTHDFDWLKLKPSPLGEWKTLCGWEFHARRGPSYGLECWQALWRVRALLGEQASGKERMVKRW